jgi:hypothetical protein
VVSWTWGVLLYQISEMIAIMRGYYFNYYSHVLWCLWICCLCETCMWECISIYTINCSEEFEDTKGVIRIRRSKDRQHNGQKKKYKRTNNDILVQSITHKTKDRVTWTPIKTEKPGMNSGAPDGWAGSAPLGEVKNSTINIS